MAPKVPNPWCEQCWCLSKDGGIKQESKREAIPTCAHMTEEEVYSSYFKKELGEAKSVSTIFLSESLKHVLACFLEKWKEGWRVRVLIILGSLSFHQNPPSAAATGDLCKVWSHQAEEVYGKTIPHVESTIGIRPFWHSHPYEIPFNFSDVTLPVAENL